MNTTSPGPIPEQPAYDPIRDFGPPAESGPGSEPELGDLEMQALRRIAEEFDAPPSIVDELAMAAFETRNLDLQLASLIADSENGSELVRSVATEPRMVSFEVGEVSIEVQLSHGENGFAINGLVAGATGVVVVETPTDSFEAPIDEAGWFWIESVVAGALRLRLSETGGGGVVTEWFTT